MQKRALLTGVAGQDGSFLAELLLDKGYAVSGIVRRHSEAESQTSRIEHIRDQMTLVYGDVTDGAGLSAILARVRPHEIYNLAAMSHVRVSFDAPIYTAHATAIGTHNLLEAVKGLDLPCRIYHASSSEQFGAVAETPQRETTPFRPQSPYAISKCYAHEMCCLYRRAHGMHISCGLLFNHESPRRGETFVTRKITRAATRIKEGLQHELLLGNLDAKRDWGSASDFVRAMHLMLQQDTPDDYVIATGETHSVREFLDEVFGYLDLEWQKYVRTDPRLYRPAEVDLLLGDASKARRTLGWEPTVTFKGLARMMTNADWALAKRERAVGEMVA